MADIITDYPGAKIRKIRNRSYVVLNLQEMAQGSASIGWLAHLLHLQPETALNALLGYRSNAHVIRKLFEDNCPDQRWKNYGTARRLLRESAFTYSGSNDSGTLQVTETPYLNWNVQPDPGKPILFPLTEGFKKFLKETTEKRERMARYKAASPAFTALENKDLLSIRINTEDLKLYIKWLRDWTKDDASDVVILESLDGLLGAMLNHPQKPMDQDDKNKATTLRAKLKVLKEEAYKDILLKPPNAPDVEKAASDLLKDLEDPGFVSRIKTLVSYKDVAGAKLWQETCEDLKNAYITLLMSPKAEYVLENHILPMINTVASRTFDTSGMPNLKHVEFANAVKNVPSTSNSLSVLNIMGKVLATSRISVRNLSAVQSLVTSVVEVAAPAIMRRVFKFGNTSVVGQANGGLLFRFITNAAGLDQQAQNVLLNSIDEGKLNDLKSVDWSRNFSNSPIWGCALAIVGVISLLIGIGSNDKYTLKWWTQIASSGLTTALGALICFRRFSTLITKHVIEGIGGDVLGAVGGEAGVAFGTETALEEYHTGDYTGAWLAGLGALGGAMTVAGYLVAAGVGTSSTGIGAPIGAGLIIVGGVIAAGTGVIALIRNIYTTGTQKVFEEYLVYFSRSGGAYSRISTVRPKLAVDFREVQVYMHSINFWEVDHSIIPELHDIGFSVECIAAIVDEKSGAVRQALKNAKRKIT